MNPRDLPIRGITIGPTGSTGCTRPAEKPHRSMFPQPPTVFVQVFILHGLAPASCACHVRGLERTATNTNFHEVATHKARPPTPQTLRGLPSMLLPNSGQVRAPLRGQARGVGHPKRQICPKWAALNLDRKADPSLVHRADSLVMTTFLDRARARRFGLSESVAVETENSCYRIRTKGEWDVGRFRRAKFLTRINTAAPPTRPTRLAVSS